MTLSCYIVDDESPAIRVLENFINVTPGLELAGFSVNPLVALNEISERQPSVTFLDVDMPELNGLQFAGMVNSQTTVVFTTAYREYALEAFEKEAADYLLKPISYERFLICIQKIRKNLTARAQSVNINTLENSFFVKTGVNEKLVLVNLPELMYVTGADHFIEIHLKQQKIITYLTLAEMLDKLPSEHFTRIHKSHIIHHAYIRTVEPGQVKLQDGIVLPIGRSYRAAFWKKFNPFFLTSKWNHPA